jgi:hypothetical protein
LADGFGDDKGRPEGRPFFARLMFDGASNPIRPVPTIRQAGG